MRRDAPFQHPAFPIYLVTRLAAYDLADVKAMIDRSLAARNRGKFVIDLQSAKDEPGNDWLRTAAMLLPASRVVLDETTRPLYNQTDVIGYASWGSNDDHRTQRLLHFQWLPGAIAAEFVSTSARTFQRPPDTWTPSGNWADKSRYFAGTPQGLVADLIHEGATGAVRQRLRALPERLCPPRLPAAGLQSGAQSGRVLLPFADLPELAERDRRRSAVRAQTLRRQVARLRAVVVQWRGTSKQRAICLASFNYSPNVSRVRRGCARAG